MDSLARLFGSPARLKLLRLFIFNDEAAFTVADAALRARVSKDATRKELSNLAVAGVLRKKTAKMAGGYGVDKRFAHFEALKLFLRSTTDISDADVVATLKRAGPARLVVLSGLFTGAIESKIDLLVVGDRLDEKALATAVHGLEAELGRELRYACFSTEDFRYRLGVYDRLLRDLFDFPHRLALDRIGLASR